MKKIEIEIMDKETLSDKETLFEVFGEPDEFERQTLINAMVDRAKELKCTRQIQSLIKAFQAEMKKAMREEKVSRMTEFGYPHADEMECGSWVANNNGVSILTMLGEMIACYHPILPVERLRNIETKTEKIRLAYKRNNIWYEITVDKEMIASASKIVGLAKYGVAVTSENAKWLVRFLADLENYNDLPVRNSTSKLGWIGDEFIPYDRAISIDSENSFRELLQAVEECGSYDVWLQHVNLIRKNTEHPEPRICLAASFASILVRPLNMLPFIVNIWGGSGKGKTVALMLAASVWANPAEGKFITDSYATQNAFEARLDILNHLPLLMDDLSKTRDKLKDNFTDLVYLLCSGKGKDRSNVDMGLNRVKTWRNTILSNMERPLATDTMRGGAINRIIDIGMRDGDMFRNGNATVEVIRENYGFAGREFLAIVREIGIERISEIRKEYEVKLKEEAAAQDSVKEDKQVMPMSLILTADALVTDHIFRDGIYLDIPEMVGHLKGVEEVSEFTRGFEYIVNYVNSHPNEFYPNEETGEYKGRMGGFIKDGYMYINPNVLRDIAKEGNFSVQAFCREARAKDMLKCNSKMQQIAMLDGVQQRFYCIRQQDFGWLDADDEIELLFE